MFTALISCLHVLIGPDHYLPLAVMSKSHGWSGRKTVGVTLLCACAHLLSSFLIISLLHSFRLSIEKFQLIETTRGDLAAWGLMTVGFLYFLWSLKSVFRPQDGGRIDSKGGFVFWSMLTIFVIGPCEPLVILLSHPLVAGNIYPAVLIAGLFSVVTVVTMFLAVMGTSYGLSFFCFPQWSRYVRPAVGLVLFFCGAGIQFLGL